MSNNRGRRDRLEAARNRARQARRLEQILAHRRRYKRVSLPHVSFLRENEVAWGPKGGRGPGRHSPLTWRP